MHAIGPLGDTRGAGDDEVAPRVAVQAQRLSWRRGSRVACFHRYLPLGYGQYLENVGEDPVQIVIVFNNGTYEDISVTQWFAGSAADFLGANFGVAPSTFADFPKEGAFIAAGKG